MKLTELQALADKASDLFDHCVIGGGAVRDAFLGGPIKDIDLFVDVRDLKSKDYALLVHGLATVLKGTARIHHEGSIAGHYATYHIMWDGPVVEVLPVERCVFTDIHDYDFGISQCQITKAGMTYTARFTRDVQDHTMTYTKDASSTPSALRLVRLLMKYPNLTVKNAACLQELVNEAMPAGLGIQL
jgi:hypothetical protein